MTQETTNNFSFNPTNVRQEDLLNSQTFSRFVNRDTALIKSFSQIEEQKRYDDYLFNNSNRIDQILKDIETASSKNDGFLKALFDRKFDPDEPVVEGIKATDSGYIRDWMNAGDRSNWQAYSQRSAATDPGTLFGYSGRAVDAKFAGSYTAIDGEYEKLSPDAKALIDRSKSYAESQGLRLNRNNWGGLEGVGETVSGIYSFFAAPWSESAEGLGARKLNEGTELWYRLYEGDPEWKANSKARKEIANAIVNGDQKFVFELIGLTEKDIEDAPSLTAAMERVNQRVLAFQEGQAMAHAGTTELVFRDTWEMLKAMPSDPDSVFELGAAVAFGVATGGISLAAYGTRLTQRATARAAGRVLFNGPVLRRAAKTAENWRRLSEAASTTAGWLESAAKASNVTRKFLTPTTWSEEILVPTVKQAWWISREASKETAEALAIKELSRGSVFGIALRNSLFDMDAPGGLTGLAANMADGAWSELLAYAATRDEEADYARFIYGDDVNPEDYAFSLHGALQSMGYGAMYGAILGGAIRTATGILTSPGSYAKDDFKVGDIKDLVKNIRQKRTDRKNGVLASTMYDLASGGIRSKRVILENVKSSAVSRGFIHADDAEAMSRLEVVVDTGIANGVDMAKAVKESGGNPVELNKIIQRESKTTKAQSKRDAQRRANEHSPEKRRTSTKAAVALNTAVVEKAADNGTGTEAVNRGEVVRELIDDPNTDPEIKATLIEIEEGVKEASNFQVYETMRQIDEAIEGGLSEVDDELQDDLINTVAVNSGLNPMAEGTVTTEDTGRAIEKEVARRQEEYESQLAETQARQEQVNKEALEEERQKLLVDGRKKGGYSLAALKKMAEGLGITFGKNGDLPAKPGREALVNAIMERRSGEATTVGAAVVPPQPPQAVKPEDVTKEARQESQRRRLQQNNGSEEILKSITDSTDVLMVTEGTLTEAVTIQAQVGVERGITSFIMQQGDRAADARNKASVYSPIQMAKVTKERYDSIKEAGLKLPPETRKTVAKKIKALRDKEGLTKKDIEKAVYREYGINVGVNFEISDKKAEVDESGKDIIPEKVEVDGEEKAYLTKEEVLSLYEQLTWIAAISDAFESDALGDWSPTETQKFWLGDPTTQNRVARQALASIMAIESKYAKEGKDAQYVTYRELIEAGWPIGHENLLHSAFGEAEALESNNAGNSLFHIVLLRSMVEERVARSAEDSEFTSAYRQEQQARIDRIEEGLEGDVPDRIRNKLIKYRSQAMIELTVVNFIANAGVNTSVTQSRVNEVINSPAYGNKDTSFADRKAKYMRRQETKFVEGVMHALSRLPDDSPAFHTMLKKMGLQEFIRRKLIFTPDKDLRPNQKAQAIRERKELAEGIARWAVSQSPDLFGNVTDANTFGGLSKLWDGSLDAVDGFTAGNALIEAVFNFRNFGTSKGDSLAAGVNTKEDEHGYLGQLSNRGFMLTFERHVQDKTNEHILFDTNPETGEQKRKFYTEADVEERLAYYERIESLINLEQWDKLSEFVQNTPYAADLRRGIAPQQLITELQGEIQNFRDKYESRVEWARITPPSVIHTLHDQALSMRNSSAAYHVFGSLPETPELKPLKAMINAKGDTGLKTGTFNAGSFKDAWAVKSSRIWGTASGMASFARASGRHHLAALMSSLEDNPIQLLSALHEAKDGTVVVDNGKVKVTIDNDEDASAQAVEVAQSIYDDFHAGVVHLFLERNKTSLETWEKAYKEAKLDYDGIKGNYNRADPEHAKIYAVYKNAQEKRNHHKAISKVKITTKPASKDIKDRTGQDVVITEVDYSKVPINKKTGKPEIGPKDIPGLNQAVFRDFLAQELNTIKTVGGGEQVASALAQYQDKFVAEKGADNYSLVGVATLENENLTHRGWTILSQVAEIASLKEGQGFKDLSSPIASWFRSDVFKPPVMTKVYSAGKKAFRNNTIKVLNELDLEDISDLALREEFKKLRDEGAVTEMANELVFVLVGDKDTKGTIETVLGLPNTDVLIEQLNARMAYDSLVVYVPDGQGGEKRVDLEDVLDRKITQEELTQLRKYKEVGDSKFTPAIPADDVVQDADVDQDIYDRRTQSTDKDMLRAIRTIGERVFGGIADDSSFPMLGLWVARLEMGQRSGNITQKAKDAAIRRMFEFIQDAKATSAQKGIPFDEALRRIVKPVSSYLQSVEHLNRTSVVANNPIIMDYMEDMSLTVEDLDSISRAQLGENALPMYARNRVSTGRSFKFTDTSAMGRPMSGESSTEETLGIGDEQVGTLVIGDAFASLMEGQETETDALRSTVLQDMEMELGGILKPLGFTDPNEKDFVETARKNSYDPEKKKRSKNRNARLKEIDGEIAALKKKEREEGSELTEEEIYRMGRLTELRKVVIKIDDDGKTTEQADRTLIPVSVSPQNRLTTPDVSNVSMPNSAVQPTALGVPSLRALRTKLHSRQLQDAEAAKKNLQSEQRSTFSIQEMATASPISPAYTEAVRAESSQNPVELSDAEYIAGIRTEDQRSKEEIKQEVEGENLSSKEHFGDSLTSEERIAGVRSLRLAHRLAETRRREKPRGETKSDRKAAQRARMRQHSMDALNLTHGAISVSAADAGKRKHDLDRGEVAPGRRSSTRFKQIVDKDGKPKVVRVEGEQEGDYLKTFGEMLVNYAFRNQLTGMAGLMVGPVDATGVLLRRPDMRPGKDPRKAMEEIVPKLTSRGPTSVFFLDFMLMGGANKEFTMKALAAMYMDRTKLAPDNAEVAAMSPTEFVAWVNADGFLKNYTEWNNVKFGLKNETVQSIPDADAKSKIITRDLAEEKQKFWDDFEDYEDGKDVTSDNDFQTVVSEFYDSMFEEMATEFPELPRLKLDEDTKMFFYGIYEMLENEPQYREFLFQVLGLDADDPNITNLDVAAGFTLALDDVDNNFFVPLLEKIKNGPDEVIRPTQFGARYNSMEVSDPTLPSGARPTFTAMEQLHILNLSRNKEIVHKLLVASMFGVDIELDLEMSSKLREKSDRFDTSFAPAHGFARTPLTERNAEQLRVEGDTNAGWKPEALGAVLWHDMRDTIDPDSVFGKAKGTDINSAQKGKLGLAYFLLNAGLVDKNGTVHIEAEKFLSGHSFDVSKEDISKIVPDLAKEMAKKQEQPDLESTSSQLEDNAVIDDDFDLPTGTVSRSDTTKADDDFDLPTGTVSRKATKKADDDFDLPTGTVSRKATKKADDKSTDSKVDPNYKEHDLDRLYKTMDELNEILDQAENEFSEIGAKFVDLEGPAGPSRLVNFSARNMVAVEVNGEVFVFYQSSGLAGKEKVPRGVWYVIGGIRPDGSWIAKTSDGMMSNYGSPQLKKIGDILTRATMKDGEVTNIKTTKNNIKDQIYLKTAEDDAKFAKQVNNLIGIDESADWESVWESNLNEKVKRIETEPEADLDDDFDLPTGTVSRQPSSTVVAGDPETGYDGSVKPVTPEERNEAARNVTKRLHITRTTQTNTPEGDAFLLALQSSVFRGQPGAQNAATLFKLLTGRDKGVDKPVSDFEAMQLIQTALVDSELGFSLFGGNLRFNPDGEISTDIQVEKSVTNQQRMTKLIRTMNGVNEISELLGKGQASAALAFVLHELSDSNLYVADRGEARDLSKISTSRQRTGNTKAMRNTFLRDFVTVEGISKFEELVDALGIRIPRIDKFISELKRIQKTYNITLENLVKAQPQNVFILELEQNEPEFLELVREAYAWTMTGVLLTKAGKVDLDKYVSHESGFKDMVTLAATRIRNLLKDIQEYTREFGVARKPDKDPKQVRISSWGWLNKEDETFFNTQWKTITAMSARADEAHTISSKGLLNITKGVGRDGTLKTVYAGGELGPADSATALEMRLADVERRLREETSTIEKHRLLAERTSLQEKQRIIRSSVEAPSRQARIAELRAKGLDPELGIPIKENLTDEEWLELRDYEAETALKAFRATQSMGVGSKVSSAASLMTFARGLSTLPSSPFDDIRGLTVAGNPNAINATTSLNGWVPQQFLADKMSRDLQRFYNRASRYFKIFNKFAKASDPATQNVGLDMQRRVHKSLNNPNESARQRAISNLDLSPLKLSSKEEGRFRDDLLAMGELVFNPESGLIHRIVEQSYRAGVLSKTQRDKIRKSPRLPYLLRQEHVSKEVGVDSLREKLVNRAFKELKDRYDGSAKGAERGGPVFVNRDALVGIGSIMTEEVGTDAARLQFNEMPEHLQNALLELAEKYHEKKPEDYSTWEPADKAAWASKLYAEELVLPVKLRTEETLLTPDNPILIHYRKSLDTREEASWNGERGERGVLTGRSKASAMYDKWANSRDGRDAVRVPEDLGLLENFALKEAIVLKNSGHLNPDHSMFGRWEDFFSGNARKAGREDGSADPDISLYQSVDLLQIIPSLFKGRTGDSYGTVVQQNALGLQGMDFLDLVYYLKDKLKDPGALFSVNGEMRQLTSLERKRMGNELTVIEEQNDTLFLRKPRTLDETDDALEGIFHDLSTVGIGIASAGNWTTSVLAEVTSGFARTIANMIRGDLQAPLDYIKGFSPAKRQRVLESVNAHEFSLHKIGQISQLGDIGFDAVSDGNISSESISPLRRLGRGIRSVSTYGFSGINTYTRYVSSVQGIRQIQKMVHKDRFVELGELFEELPEEPTRKDISAAARKAGVPDDVAAQLFYGGANNLSMLMKVQDAVKAYLKEDGFDFDGFHTEMLAHENTADAADGQAAVGHVLGMVNAFNRRNNLDPTFGNRQVPRNMMERLLASLGQYPILAYSRMRQHMWQGGITGVASFIVPLIMGEITYTTIMQAAKGEDPEEILERWENDPEGALLKVLENLPVFGRLQTLQPMLMGLFVKFVNSLDQDFAAGYKDQTLRYNMVSLPGLEMFISSLSALDRATEQIYNGDYEKGVANLGRVAPVPFKPAMRIFLNYLFQSDPLLRDSNGGSTYNPTRHQTKTTPMKVWSESEEGIKARTRKAEDSPAGPDLVQTDPMPVKAQGPDKASEGVTTDPVVKSPPEQPKVPVKPEPEGLDKAGASPELADLADKGLNK